MSLLSLLINLNTSLLNKSIHFLKKSDWSRTWYALPLCSVMWPLSLFSDWQEEVPVATARPQRNRMDRLLEILNSMKNNSSGVENQLTTFMEEAQNSADSEETLNEIVHTIYRKAVSDRSFAATAAKLCDKMALFMVEGTKFRSLLLNLLQVRTECS